MITAKEARSKVESLETEKGLQERKLVEEKILSTVEKGETYCWLHIWISEPTENWLKRLGYDVERSDSQKDGCDVKVSW